MDVHLAIHLCMLVLYLVSLFWIGIVVVRIFFRGLPWLFSVVGAFLIGSTVGVPITYAITWGFAQSRYPMEWGVGLYTIISLLIVWLLRQRYVAVKYDISVSDICMVFFSLVLGAWLMIKTFHAGPDGQIFVGSNTVFDFGFTLGLIRSISWGSNIPFMSPFFAGFPIFYHYMFAFWVALWEYFGVPIVWAMNTLSILAFASLLVIIYSLPQILWKLRPLVGWIAVLFTVTNSTMTFWKLLMEHGLTSDLFSTIWKLSAYPFAGPYDGSVISIFMTLNNYVNQRHLAFSLAVGLWLFIVADGLVKEKTHSWRSTFPLGFLSGILFLWNMPVSGLVAVAILSVLAVKRLWSHAFVYSFGVLLGVLCAAAPYIPLIGSIGAFVNLFLAAGVRESRALAPQWTVIGYLWNNLGILPIAAIGGYLVLPKRTRSIAAIFLVLFAILCIAAVVGHRGFDQKFFSFLIIGVNVVAAVGIGWLLNKNKIVALVIACVCVIVMTVSGIVDLMPMKNEFAYPLISRDSAPLISWIYTSTPKQAVFVSYTDIIDPVVLAGRKNYFGFFGNIGWYDRSTIVRKAYAGDPAVASTYGISYILVPRSFKNDFNYTIDESNLRKNYSVAYQDPNYIVFSPANKN